MREGVSGWPGLEIQERTLGNVQAQGGNVERMTGYSWRRGCPGQLDRGASKGTRGHSMAGRSQGRGEGMEQPSEEPSRPLEALCCGAPPGRVSALTFTRCFLCCAPSSSSSSSLSSSRSAAGKGSAPAPEPPSALCRPCRPRSCPGRGRGEGEGQSCRGRQSSAGSAEAEGGA